ncbi:MAG: hypothetical protein RLZZ244_682 [Verrucomicrobiota bacterium]|jgi:YHS domain-containing protein
MKSLWIPFLFTLVAALASAPLSAHAANPIPGVPDQYPLKTCPVSEEKLGEHGKPFKATAPDGTDVYLCCKNCLKEFQKDPAKHAKAVKDASKK